MFRTLTSAWLLLFGSGCCFPAGNEPPAAPGGRPATEADVDAMMAPHQARLDATRRPVVRIALEPLAPDDVHASKVGGRPWWPEGITRPVDRRGHTLALLAQVDLAALPAPLPGYPSSGLVQFFIAADDVYGLTFDGPDAPGARDGYRVVYWPDTSGPAAPDVVVAPDLLPFDPAKPRRMRFTRADEILTHTDFRYDTVFPVDFATTVQTYAADHGIDAVSLEDRARDRDHGTGHKLGGYPFFTQMDPRGDATRELLLQLDSDNGFGWGDGGVANFFIAPADLARADFHDVVYSWDCY